MISVVSNAKAPVDAKGRGPSISGYSKAVAPDARILHKMLCLCQRPATTSGEGELHNQKRTEGVRLARESKPVSQCDGITPAFMGFLTFWLYGGKGANAPEFTSVHKGLGRAVVVQRAA